MKKSIIALFLAFTLIFSVVSGCDGGSGSTQTSKDPVENSQSTSISENSSESIISSNSSVANSSSEKSSSSSSSKASSSSSSNAISSKPTSTPSSSSSTVVQGNYSVKGGTFTESGNKITSTSAGAIAIKNGASFSSGTLYANVNIATTGADNGIVFRVTNPNNLSTYWEENVSYYFFFLSAGNSAYLGKVNNGSWLACQTAPFTVVAGSTYTLSISIDESTKSIRGFVNGKLMVGYQDNQLLSGTEYGVRAGKEGITFDAFSTETSIAGSTISSSEFSTTAGSWSGKTNGLTSGATNSIAVKNNETFKYGILETSITLNGSATDNGIVFGLSSDSSSFWEQVGTSYYFFFISRSGSLCIAKTDNNVWKHFADKPIPSFSNTGTYKMRIERNSLLTYLYLNDTLYLTLSDTSLQGTGFGLRAGSSGISFTGLKNLSGFESVLPSTPSDFTAVSGGVYGTNNSFVSTANTIALHNTAHNKGNFSVNIAANTNQETGVVFGYVDADNYYRFYTQKTTQTVKVAKKVNGVETVIYSNYLSAGYSESGSFYFNVILTNNKAYCHFFNTRYAVIDINLSVSSKVGVYAQGQSALFTNFTLSSDETVLTVDTLLFGHSYFELWNNWRTDLASLNLGTYTNIGIGGSVASHWYNFRESILTFKPTQVIYMIGINDVTAGVSPENTSYYVRDLLLYLKENIPSLNVILLGVNHCPARYTGATHDRKAEVIKTNELYRQLVLDYDSWINFVELEHSFSDSSQTPLASWFTDGLHPTAAGYTQIIVPGIKSALNGENQPVADPSQTASLLAEAKQIRIDSLSSYAKHGFRASEWATAEPIYNSAINAINNCTTRTEVLALDLSSYVTQLDAIKHCGDYAYLELLNQTYNTTSYNYSSSLWETTGLTNNLANSKDGYYLIGHDGHRLNTNYLYTDMDFKFKMTDNTGPTDVFGVMFLATQNDNLGIDGYIINLVSDPNYIQVWYFNNAWGLNGSGSIIEYIGGWVFPGEIENTLFRAIVKNGKIRIYTEADYQSKGAKAYGCEVDLTNNGTYSLYTSGYYGYISWKNNNVTPNFTAKLYIQDVCGTTKINYAKELTSNVITNTNCHSYQPALVTDGGAGQVNAANYSFKLYKGITASDFTMQVYTEGIHEGVGVAGYLIRATKNATNNGIDGYLVNFVTAADKQYLQLFYLKNCYNSDGSALVCDYIGGWVYSTTSTDPILGQTLTITVSGNTLTASNGTRSVSFGLNGDQVNADPAKYPIYSSGGFGFISWQDNFDINLEIKSLII